jgi:hypothetical protein
VIILHLSNRNLELNRPAMAVARAAGGAALIQHYRPSDADRGGWPSPEDAVIVAKTPAALAAFTDPRWRLADARGVRPWTDDYVNLVGALWRRMLEKMDPNGDE